MVKMVSDNEILRVVHDTLHAIAFDLKQTSERIDRMAELLHAVGSQTRMDEYAGND
jgi:hypothetical protein